MNNQSCFWNPALLGIFISLKIDKCGIKDMIPWHRKFKILHLYEDRWSFLTRYSCRTKCNKYSWGNALPWPDGSTNGRRNFQKIFTIVQVMMSCEGR